jgi:hypothetical protein
MSQRVSVHVAPRLLSEGLLLELSRRSFRVTPTYLPGNDVAVVVDPIGSTAKVVIKLVGEDAATVTVGDQDHRRPCRSVDDLVALIHEFTA